MGWDLETTTDLGTLVGVTTNNEGQITKLVIASRNLISIPPAIGQLINLTNLNIRDNQLTSIPPEIGQLSNLESLFLNNNQLTSLPLEIGQLINLEYLYLNDNQLISLPPEIGFLIKLIELDVRGNFRLNSILFAICNLRDFHVLDLEEDIGVFCSTTSAKSTLISIYSANPEKTLDWGVDNYPGITFNNLSNPIDITLNDKNLTRIPEGINALGDLEVLYINGNNISSLPEVTTNLAKLHIIGAASNNLTTVPDSFKVLPTLALLSITNNPISSIPQGVCDLQTSNGGILTILTDREGCN